MRRPDSVEPVSTENERENVSALASGAVERADSSRRPLYSPRGLEVIRPAKGRFLWEPMARILPLWRRT